MKRTLYDPALNMVKRFGTSSFQEVRTLAFPFGINRVKQVFYQGD